MPVDYIGRDGARAMNGLMTDPCLNISSFFCFPCSQSPTLRSGPVSVSLTSMPPPIAAAWLCGLASGVLGLQLPGVLKIGKAVSRHTERFP